MASLMLLVFRILFDFSVKTAANQLAVPGDEQTPHAAQVVMTMMIDDGARAHVLQIPNDVLETSRILASLLFL